MKIFSFPLFISLFLFFSFENRACDTQKLEDDLKTVIYQNNDDLNNHVRDLYKESGCTEADPLLPFTEFALLGLAPEIIIPNDVVEAIKDFQGEKMHNGLCQSGGTCSHRAFCCFPGCYFLKTKNHRRNLRWGAVASLGIAAASNTCGIVLPAILGLSGETDGALYAAISLGVVTLLADANAILAVYRGHYRDAIDQGDKGKEALDKITRLTLFLESNLPFIIEEYLRGMIHHDKKVRDFTLQLWKNLASQYQVKGIDDTVSSKDEVGVFLYFLSELTELINFIQSEDDLSQLDKILNHYSIAVNKIQTGLNSDLVLDSKNKESRKALEKLREKYEDKRPAPEIPPAIIEMLRKMKAHQV